MSAEPASNAPDRLSLIEAIGAATRLAAAGDAAGARQLYKTWIERNPDDTQLYIAYFNCASLDSQAKDREAAAASLDNAIALNPDFVPAYINLGRLHEDSGAPERAVELWRLAASRTAPVNGNAVLYATTALAQMARLLSALHQSEPAEAAILQCLDINPRQPDIIEQYTALRLSQCKWPIAVASEHLDRNTLLGGINPLSMAAYTDDPLLQLASAYRYVKRSAWDGPHGMENDRRDAAIDLSGRRLRVGYVSSDLRDHAIGYLMAELFEVHKRRDVEVFAYYCGPASDSPLARRIKAAVEHWIDIRPMSDDEAAARIAADGIDVLVDVNGHTRDARTGVFARRPAPVQVNWLGYPGSMGSPYHHYIIADDWIIPQGSEIYYSEKVVRLPCYQANDRKRVIAPERPGRAAAGLPEDAFVFCCFNGSHKISRFTFERWVEILGRAPGSVLWLLDTSEKTKARLGDHAERKGVARSRLIFAPKIPNPDHLARYPLADLFLDTAPYGAHTTASDALWMGVPVLTLSGRSFASRVCGSLVRAAGLDDLVFTDPDAYVARAVALATGGGEIEAYKAKLRADRDTCLLFDTGRLVASLENIYRGLCAEHGKGVRVQPDLANLDAYFEAGLAHDHDAEEALRIAGYHESYKTRLKRFHLARPLAADTRLWRPEDIAAAECRAAPAAPAQTAALLQTDVLKMMQSATRLQSANFESIRLLNAQGRILECLESLLALKAHRPGDESLIGEVRAVIGPTVQCFNQLAAAGNIEEAARYADSLAALLPGNVAVLNSALSCSLALGRKQQAERYAQTLVGIDPSNQTAREALTRDEAKPAAPATAAEAVAEAVEKTVVEEAVAEEKVHPLIRLRDLYDQASAILCGTLTDSGAEQVGRLLEAARQVEISVPPDSEWAAWEKHYRLAVEAADPSSALGPTPKPARHPKVVFATASGKKLELGAVRAAAKSLRARTVFFAAADQAYVDLYGRAYIESILEHADVAGLIVLHVIGGAKRLPQIAKALGIASNRLVFAGDDFDAATVKTRCHDAPSKGLSAHPVAHLQSVRFLTVGPLLQALKLPVFVSDIDLVLQRGVADLLETFKGCDVVLNENTQSANAGSRFTANLVLLNPTTNADLFLRFLGSYLGKALAGHEVTRWIDQFALLQARHHLMRREPAARIGTFDAGSDINNLMYTSYQPHPYRFLSLYHGFDMSSLPHRPGAQTNSAARVRKTAAGAPPRKKRMAVGRA